MIIVSGRQIDEKDIRRLWDDSFDEDSESWRNWYFSNVYKAENLVCAKKDKKLVSMVHMNPYRIMMRGAAINAFAMAGVATEKEHRGKGYAGNLIKYSLQRAYEMGYDFSFLYPFKYEFYETFGYMLSYYKYKYEQRQEDKEAHYNFSVSDKYTAKALAGIYMRYTSRKNGFVIRDSSYYSSHIEELLCDGGRIFTFSLNGTAGYFAINKDESLVTEIVYEGNMNDAFRAIAKWNEGGLAFENLSDTDGIVLLREKHCMARVVSLKGIFSKIEMKDVDIKIRITDDIILENNGVWHIQSANKTASIARTNDKEDFSMDISQLAPIITGIKITDNEELSNLQRILFADTEPFIFEVC
ncbi:MAG: GNAT family N-acetyltransferase [Clostridia bacterium]|nr:GNAT family N-acetyltransferase [Clostridia bacterium]